MALRHLIVLCGQHWAAGAAEPSLGRPPPPEPPDLCAGAPTQCSAEICDLQPGQISRLKPGTYYHDKQIFLPQGSAIIGAGINVTHIVACGLPLASRCNLTERRGFLMGDDTYVGNFTFAGRENKRGGCSLGAGLIETPGCMGDYCHIPGKNTTGGRWGPGGDPSAHGDPLCNPPGRGLEQCVGITNATAEYIHLISWTMDHVGWFPSTVPWGKDETSGSKNITLRNLTAWGTWADGINFHGGHKNALVEGCEISYTGDDLYAVWPQATFRPGFNNTHDPRDCSDNIIFRNNIGRAPRNGFAGPEFFCSGGCKKWSGDHTGGKGPVHKGIIQSTGTCFSLWGAGSNMAIIDNHCEETDVSVGFHKVYTNTRNLQMWCNAIAVDGNLYSNGGDCNTTGCQANDDKTMCKTAGSWPTDGGGKDGPGTDRPGTIGEDAGCNQSALASGYRQRLWKGYPSVAFPDSAKLKTDDEHGACQHQLNTGGGGNQKRCDAYPEGLKNITLDECCGLCAPGNKINCSAWIHTSWHKLQPGGAGMCWPMAWVEGTRPKTGTVIGGHIVPGPPPAPPGPISPQPPLPKTDECRYQKDTVYEQPTAEGTWAQTVQTTGAGQCCAICRSIPECFVANYEPVFRPPVSRGGRNVTSLASTCNMRGQMDLTRPTKKPNATACVVNTRPPPALPAPPGAMHVLYIVSDDLRPEMPSYGQDYVKAPNLAKLSARSLTFVHAYVQQSICSPSRNSFMSGKRPQNTRVWNFINDFRQEFPFHPSFPGYFKMHGYLTLGHSKLYHPGHPLNEDQPLSWTQDAPNGTDTGIPVRKDGTIADYPAYHRDSGKSSGCGYFDVCPTVDGSRDQFVDHHTATQVIATMNMAVKDKRPFFLGVGMIRPHLPFIVPEDTWKLYSEDEIKLPASPFPPVNVANISLNDQIFSQPPPFCPDGQNTTHDCPSVERSTITRPTSKITPFNPFDANNTRFLRHGYYAAVTFVDEQVGRMVDHVETLGLTNKTIVIFHGDHGWHLGEQGLWTKKTCFELGTRVPLIIAAPHIAASYGKRTLHMAEMVDVYPTVAALSGLPVPPGMDGISLLPAFTNPAASPGAKSYAFSEFPQCPTDPDINLWHTSSGCQNVVREEIGFFGFSIRSASYRYTEWHPWSKKLKADWATMTGVELYDYRKVDMADFDQFDRVNVAGAAEHAAAEKELATALHAHYSRM